jgi:diguanylate cyclase (GGDEF)-like protein
MAFFRKNMALVVLFILFEVFIVVALNSIYMEKRKLILDKRLEVFKAYFRSSITSYEKTTDVMFKEVISQDKILGLFKDAYTSSAEEQQAIRNKIYSELKSSYSRLKVMKLRQFHFHLPDNRSFLRFHKPEKFGDNLTNVRESVRLANMLRTPISGFEEGRLLNSYRFVQPLFWQGKHIGSAEASLSLFALKGDVERHKNSFVSFMISKDIIDRKVWSSAKDNYIESDLSPDYMYEKRRLNSEYYSNLSEDDIRNINRLLYSRVSKKLKFKKEFSLSVAYGDDSYIVSFIPIKNVAGERGASYIISYEKSNILQTFDKDHIIISVIVSLLNLLIFFFIYIMVRQNFELKTKTIELAEEELKLRELNEQFEMKNIELTTLFNIQRDMIILTDGERVEKYNSKFLEFFGYSSIDEFFEGDKKVYDLFIYKSGFIHGGNGKNWIHDMIEMDQGCRELRAIFYSKQDKEERYFSLQYSRYPLINGYYLISFSDITESYKYLQLMESINRKQQELLIVDGLTGVYNRRHFDSKLQSEIDRTAETGENLTFIIIDIDFFKQYNDTYGHQAGDTALKRVSKRVQEEIKEESELVFRLGGEEFGAIYSNYSLDESLEIAEKVKRGVESLKIEHKSSLVSSYVTISVGLAFVTIGSETSFQALYDKADQALYLAKRGGRNRVSMLY